jgi:hypothetical protein
MKAPADQLRDYQLLNADKLNCCTLLACAAKGREKIPRPACETSVIFLWPNGQRAEKIIA